MGANKYLILISLQIIFLLITSVYHAIATRIETRKYPPPGQLIDIDGYKLHLYSAGEGSPTVVFDHSIGSLGWSNYFVFQELAKTTRVVVCDRAGYGWSETSPKPRTSEEVVKELHTVLTKAGIESPYILVGDSFGGYTARLYAHKFPEKVVGMVLTHAIHEETALNFPLSLKIMAIVFLVGFKTTQIVATLGIVRLAGLLGFFEFFKKELRNFPQEELKRIKLSYYLSKHWEAMYREVRDIKQSSQQMKQAGTLGNMPLVVITVSNFLKRSYLTAWLPLRQTDESWKKMQDELVKLSSNSKEIIAEKSGHFVWIDEPEVMVQAVRELVAMVRK